MSWADRADVMSALPDMRFVGLSDGSLILSMRDETEDEIERAIEIERKIDIQRGFTRTQGTD